MAVSTGQTMSKIHESVRALGDKAINADFALEIEGFEGMWLLAKQCPWPELSTTGEIEVAAPLGSAVWQAQQTKFNQQGAVTLMETTAGSVDEMLLQLLTRGGKFNAKIYEGTPDAYRFYKPIKQAFLQMDNPDRDWENRAQTLNFTGTMFFHYYGEKVAGGGFQ